MYTIFNIKYESEILGGRLCGQHITSVKKYKSS